MKNKNILILMFLSALILLGNSCKKDILVVENGLEPDRTKALATHGDVEALAAGLFNVWFDATQEYDGPALAMGTMADQLTCSWGNAGMLDLSSEPRVGFNNTVTYAYSSINLNYFQSLYGAISSANDVLNVVESGDVDFKGNDELLKAWSYFIQGISHGYIALAYDQGFIVDETTDLALDNPPVGYQELSDASIAYLDKCIAVCEANEFTLPDNYIAGYSGEDQDFLKQLASSFAAQILALTPRTKAENDAVDWTAVLTYANNGIDTDLAPVSDDNIWYSPYRGYGNYPGWVRIDHRIINLMDHAYPSRWPNDNVWPNGDPGEASSSDARLASDFEYLSDNNFKPDRGYYHFSHYKYKRYDDWMVLWMGPTPIFRAAENDMYKAEAMVMTNDNPGAIGVINSGSRVLRGGLAPLSASATKAEILDAIYYERDIELIMTGCGLSFYDMRKRDMLQSGTILHFPIPGLELESLNMPYYTIQGSPDGVNISNGNWTGFDN